MSNLDNVFNVAEIPPEKDDITDDFNPLTAVGEESDIDAKYIRQNQIEFIEISKAAVNTAMRIASESESPRAIETLAIMLKTASEMNRQLIQQHKDKAEVKSTKTNVTPQIGQSTTNNIIMTGSLKDITKMLKDAEANIVDI